MSDHSAFDSVSMCLCLSVHQLVQNTVSTVSLTQRVAGVRKSKGQTAQEGTQECMRSSSLPIQTMNKMDETEAAWQSVFGIQYRLKTPAEPLLCSLQILTMLFELHVHCTRVLITMLELYRRYKK